MNFKPLRVSVVLLGDRLATAVLSGSRVEAFIVEAETPAAALRAELDARGLPARNVALALARSAVTVKPIDLPPVAGDLRQMVGFELERHLPFQPDEASYDFVVVPNDAGAERAAGGEQRVLITAADRRVVEAALRLAEEARLRPMSLTVGVHNLPTLARVPRGAHVAWVHRAAGATDLLLLVGDALVLSRSLPGTDEALVADELRRSLLALRWRGCDAVWVSGDAEAGHTPGANPLAALGAPVTEPAWTPRTVHQIDALPEEHRGALELALAVAAGRSVRPLELLPSAVRPRRLTRQQTFTVGMAAATAVLAIVALLAPGWREQRHLNRIDAEIARLDPDVKAVDRVLRDLERKRKLLAIVDGVESAGVRPLPVLRELTEILPNDAWLTTVSLDAKGVELTGAAAAASALIPVLENSPRFERVEFSSPVTRGRDNREQFRIRASWEAAGAVAVPGTPTAPPAGPAAGPMPNAPVAPPASVGVPPGPAPIPAQPRRPPVPGPGGARQ
jgi:Tfp pilus assembly protein PilN